MKNVKKLVLAGLAFMLIFSACKKKEKEEDKDTDSASENFLATSIGNDMGNVADEAGRTKNISSFKTTATSLILSSCATIQFDTIAGSNVDTLTVNFGNANCLCNDGRYRRGSLVITFTGKYKDSLTTITITPKNYFVNDNGVTGSKTVKNLGHNAQGHLVYDITENFTIAKAGGGSIVFFGTRKREWLQGENTLIWADDKYSITGSASGYNANGRSFTSSITIPLIRDMSIGCRKHFVQGTIVHTPDGRPDRIIDFGSGACDNKATVTINNKVYEIDLP
ncbi:MAG: hypothetical protein K0S32_2025 [Bacteroidetes bacterium]|jgi:hypothetical protein|nr:hypothetical protein [Bacteroidota bacterium]